MEKFWHRRESRTKKPRDRTEVSSGLYHLACPLAHQPHPTINKGYPLSLAARSLEKAGHICSPRAPSAPGSKMLLDPLRRCMKAACSHCCQPGPPGSPAAKLSTPCTTEVKNSNGRLSRTHAARTPTATRRGPRWGCCLLLWGWRGGGGGGGGGGGAAVCVACRRTE